MKGNLLHVAQAVTHHSHATFTCEAAHVEKGPSGDSERSGEARQPVTFWFESSERGFGGGGGWGSLPVGCAFIASPLWFYTDLPVCGSAAGGRLLSWQGSGV